MNTPDTEWEKEFEERFCSKRVCRGCVREDCDYSTTGCPSYQTDVFLSTDNAPQIKVFIRNLLTSRDTYWKERVLEIAKDVCNYVEYMEEKVDGEWGNCRDWQQLYAEGTFPEFYDKVKALTITKDNLKRV